MTALVVVAIVIAVFIVVVALRPAEFRVERAATMRAPAAAPFEQVNDLQNWRAWSPWEQLDPALKRTYEGPQAGTGALYAWQGNKDVGEGRMTITESKPGEPQGENTAVTWSMNGRNNFMAKAMSLFINMDRMVGGMFERGLAQMKAVVEKR